MPCVEESYSFSIQRGGCICSTPGTECPPLLYVEEAESFSVQGSIVFSTHPRECPSAMCRGGLLFIRSIKCLLYTEARVSLLLLYATERVSSPHGGEIVLLLYEEEADSFSVQKRECLL